MGRAQVVSRQEAIDALRSVIVQLEEGAIRVGDVDVEIPDQILFQAKIRRGDHQGINIKLSWDILKEEEVIEEDPEDREWHDVFLH